MLGDQSELMDIDDVNDLVESIVGFLWLLFSNLCDLTRLQTVGQHNELQETESHAVKFIDLYVRDLHFWCR